MIGRLWTFVTRGYMETNYVTITWLPRYTVGGYVPLGIKHFFFLAACTSSIVKRWIWSGNVNHHHTTGHFQTTITPPKLKCNYFWSLCYLCQSHTVHWSYIDKLTWSLVWKELVLIVLSMCYRYPENSALHQNVSELIYYSNWGQLDQYMPPDYTGFFFLHELISKYAMEKIRKKTQLILIEFTLLPQGFVSKCIQSNFSFLSVLPVFQSDVHGFLKASFLTANYQPACCGLENECDSGINLHLNIWCPDNKISQHQAHNAINSYST